MFKMKYFVIHDWLKATEADSKCLKSINYFSSCTWKILSSLPTTIFFFLEAPVSHLGGKK